MREDFQKALTKARLDMMRKPKAMFITTVCLMMKQIVDETIPTAATDGLAIFYNPDFFLSKTREQRVTLLAHEGMHPALQHIGRGTGYACHQRFNRAADYVINDYLLLAGFEKIPGWLHDVRFRGMSTDDVYRILEAEEKDQPAPDIGDWADLKDPGESEPGSTPESVERRIREILTSAAIATQMGGASAGTVPADVQVFLDGLLKPKLPMASHLRRFFQALDKSDYSWKKLNRRYQPMLMPGLQGKKLTHIAFAFDMSSSVTDKDIQRYVSELHAVMRGLKPDKLTLVQFTCELKSVHAIKSVQDLANLELRGRGGTSIEPLMEWAKKEKPTALIVFTDGEYPHPSFNPKCPILWMIHGYSKDLFSCRFGTTIRFDV